MSIEEWAKDFKGYVNELSLLRDDYNGVMEYIDDALELSKEQERKIKELEEKLRVLERGNQDVLKGVMMPAT